MISVLCVDDDPAFLSLQKRCLEVPGVMTVTTVLSAPEALKQMETNRFDAIVSDYKMPGIDGIELLREVRAAHPGLPFILYTGKGREEVIIEALNSGADFYLQKNGEPKIQFAELKDTIFKAVKIGELWQALHDSETRYRRLFETAQDGILILDADTGQIVEVNPFLIDLLGFSREQFLGKKIWEIGLFKDIVANKDNFEELQRQEYIRYEDLPLKTSDGQRIAVEFVSNVYTVNNKKVIQCSIRNITERKQVEDALKESEKKFRERTRELSDANTKLQELDRLKSLFIASMSHELRTPLNSIIGFTGIMMKGMAGEINAEQEKQLGMVQDSARYLLVLINDVIDISKIEAGKIEASTSTFNLADLIREVRTIFGPAAQDRGLVLNIEIPGPITVTSDERRIKQNIMNLVSNAIKFTDEGRVDLTVEQKGTVVEVRVRDTGIGIRQDDLSQLFRPFVRVMVPGRLSEGTGLGLYLSKKLARFLGGNITAESEIHKGSVFTFSFPIMYEKQEDI